MNTCSNNIFSGGILRNALQCNPRESIINAPQGDEETSKDDTNLPPNKASDGGSFQINISSIKSIPKANQAHELQSLEVSVYDQEALEIGIIEQVDKALEQEKNEEIRKEYDLQIKSLQESRRIFEEQLESSETSLKNLPLKGIVSTVNEALLLRREIDNATSNIHALISQEEELIQRRKLLDDRISDDREKHRYDAESEFSSRSAGLFGSVGDEQSMDEEGERERLIRLGEMTPFGTIISKSFNNSKLNVDSPLPKNEYSVVHQDKSAYHELINLNKAGPSNINDFNLKISTKIKNDGKPTQRKNTKGMVHPKKKKKALAKEKSCEPLGLSEVMPCGRGEASRRKGENSGEESEYLPSSDWDQASSDEGERTKVQKQRKKLKRKTVNPEEWATDDSDWEYSDEDTVKRKRKRSKKVIDDGNTEDYLERLQLWEKEKIEENEEGNCNFHEFEGGLKIPLIIWNKLFSYQKVGVQWMWELHQQKCGGILGDEMGLGKTVQVIAFFAALASSPHLSRLTSRFKGLGPSLIICPTTMLHQWVEEFHTWWPPLRVAILHDSGSFSGRGGKAALIKSIYKASGILVTSYEGLSRQVDDLSLIEWHMVVLDEGHVIRNPDARITLASKRLRTPHRLILSGSPLQNNLRELWSLFDFIYPGKLGTLPVFTAEFAIPITQGGYATASQVQVVTGYKCASVLKDTIAPYLLRRMKADVKDHINLPSKNEQVLFCKLTNEQREVYREYLKSGDVDKILSGVLKVFVGLINLRKICNHPHLYTGGPKLMKWDNEESVAEEERYGYWNKSGKMIVVENLLRIWHRQGHRVLLFTQGRQMMRILENFIRGQGYKYLKLDGSTSISSRQPLINEFNQNVSHFIFLLTTKVGGLGVNLTGANRVLIYDPDWNPATDTQARERAYRPGQLRHVTVYRLVTAGTIEEKIYHRQIFKQFLTDRVLRDPRRRRFFKSNDLYELFTLHEDGDDLGKRGAKTETSAIFAGTGSEIKMPQKKKENGDTRMKTKEYKKRTSNAKITNIVSKGNASVKSEGESSLCSKNSPNIINIRNNEKNQQLSNNMDNNSTVGDTVTNPMEENITDNSEIKFSKEKIEMMKKMAQNLSMKISKQVDEASASSRLNNLSSVSQGVDSESLSGLKKTISDREKTKKLVLEGNKTIPSKLMEESSTNRVKHHSRKSRKKHKRRDVCVFEGEHVPHLVGCEEAKSKSKTEGEEDDEEKSQNQDDYVLKKLFSKSGLTTALHHDVIMEGGEADYALVEGEAERVAHEAVKALKESRRNCWRASSGVPTWTGQNGMLCQNATSSTTPKQFRFGNKKRQSSVRLGSSQKTSGSAAAASTQQQENLLSSSELLSHMRSKDGLLEYFRWRKKVKDAENGEGNGNDVLQEPSLKSTGVTREQADLLDDIRAFVACGAAQDGQATTKEILARFKDRLPPGATPQLFKSMLRAVCNFEDNKVTGSGLWKLRPEFSR